jgi:hydroxyacylglutathione hydrolase
MSVLEDDFCDIVRKARFGLSLGEEETARVVGIDSARLRALEGGAQPTDAEIDRLARVLDLRHGPLQAIAAGGYVPPQVPRSFGEWTVTPVFAAEAGAFCYAVSSPAGRFAVDAGGGFAEICRALGGEPQAVLLTHGHHDHVDALAAFGAPAYAHPSLAATVGGKALADGEEILGLRALHCPGHSPDMVTFAGPGFAFVGDTLFAGSLGRARTAGDYPALLESARRILSLPPDTALFAGHGPPTTVAAERLHNAYPI